MLQTLNKTETELASETDFTSSHSDNSFLLQPTDEFEVAKFIDRLKKDSAPGRDGINPGLIKEIKHEILVPLTHIFNTSLEMGIFPQKWKVASVTPIHKAGRKNLPETCQQISLLSTFFKFLEKIVNHRLVAYLEKFNLISGHQYSFRRGKSMEDAVELLSRKVASSLSSCNKTIGVFLDLAKAFDTISVKKYLKSLRFSE